MTGCGGRTTVVHDDSLVAYDFGPGHPMSPLRVDLTMRLAAELGVTGPGGLELVRAPMASADLIGTVHTPSLIETMERLGTRGGHDLAHGLGTDDNPVFRDMHVAGAHVVGATHEAFRQVWSGESVHSASISGGLHHAMRDRSSGFCLYNDVAVGITSLLDAGAQRVAYVDVDVHHGDGVEQIFWNDPRVLTVSLHESGRTLFPGTGWADETGGPDAPGTAVNVALPAGTGDGGWLRAFHAVVPQVLRAWQPEVLVTQHGCDSHVEDPLANLLVSLDGQRSTYGALHDLAHELCGGRWVVTGGGGYAVVDVVPRAWTHLLGIVAGRPVDATTATPEGWREHVRLVAGRAAPYRMTDGRDAAWTPWRGESTTWLDQAITATRDGVFPALGLPPRDPTL